MRRRALRIEALERRALLAATSLGVDLNGDDQAGTDFLGTFVEDAGPVLTQETDLTVTGGPPGITDGAAFQVNPPTEPSQALRVEAGGTAVASDSAGNSVVVWLSYEPDGDSWRVSSQRYDGNGSPVGGETPIATTTDSRPDDPAVAMADDGRFIVTWVSETPQDGSELHAGLYRADGTAIKPEFPISTAAGANPSEPSVAMDADGNFVVTWASAGQDGDGRGVYGQRFDASGSPLGHEFSVNTTTAWDQHAPAVAMNPDGDFVVTWASDGQDGDGWGVYGQRFGAGGVALDDEFLVNTTTQADQRFPSVAMDSLGNFVVTWASLGQDGSYWGVYGQRYSAGGVALGNEFSVNTTTAWDQHFPSVAMDDIGNFIVTWASHEPDGIG